MCYKNFLEVKKMTGRQPKCSFLQEFCTKRIMVTNDISHHHSLLMHYVFSPFLLEFILWMSHSNKDVLSLIRTTMLHWSISYVWGRGFGYCLNLFLHISKWYSMQKKKKAINMKIYSVCSITTCRQTLNNISSYLLEIYIFFSTRLWW